jgi:glycosyltransferase involved in cell wall biosynthesis
MCGFLMPSNNTVYQAATNCMSRKYNILYTINSLSGAGAELVLSNLVKYLDKDRFNVFVCQLREWGERGEGLHRQGYRISCLQPSSRKVRDYGSALRLYRFAAEHHIDLIHSHDLHGFVDGALCRLRNHRRPFLHTFHYGNYPHLPKKYLALEAICTRIADHLIAVGYTQSEMLRRTYKLKRDALITIWNGVEPAAETASQTDAERFLSRDGRLIIGSMSTMTAQKGIPVLLKAAARMRDLQDRCRFVIVGGGPMERHCRDLSHKMGLDGFVTFTGWVKHAAAILLPQFDIFLQTSLWEAMSMVILEAMAAGKPIIATKVGENPRILKNGYTALLIDPGSEDEIVSAVRAMVDRHELRQNLGYAASRIFHQRFTVDHMVHQHENLYCRILNGEAKCC